MINYYECCLWMRQELSKIKVMYGVIPWLDPVLLHGSQNRHGEAPLGAVAIQAIPNVMRDLI